MNLMSQNHPNIINCISCRAKVADINGPTFRFPDAASPGCWDLFSQILAREYTTWSFPPIHRLTVDAYAAQHPGKETVETTQALAVHLMSLYLIIERGYSLEQATYAMQHAISLYRDKFTWLTPPKKLGTITVEDVYKANNLEEHKILIGKWASDVWRAWEEHHDQISDWTYNLNY